ncbi:LacI family DNA-binding transcriptional regulator [Galbitalea sp. SE-J8]|uniref:LacI family DNA-binding transcriptional regulator n=1 Tax=Galbitalea sp. SE-J8 TaxID=3054952 RepID=UPI00259C7A3E|nr:LacI family DNA-binding transcriptional regulator [Galbitalea sp. SE-J8]MDM4763561.1 LacI family DNA-binding transcriptional regulator [Galbitalea sp. SE-J8]
MTDVARLAGVSQSTVSYVLNSTRPISEKVRARVLAAAAELAYTPRAAAQALRGGSTNTIALSVPDGVGGADGWLGLYLLQVTAAARARGYDLLIASETHSEPQSILDIMRGGRADGVILMSTRPGDRRASALEELGMPTVAIGEPLEGSLPFVDYDFRRATALAVGHLAGRGHTSIAYAGPREQERRGGYLYVDRTVDGIGRAAHDAGVRVSSHFPEDDPVADDRAFRALLDRDAPTALVVTQSFTATDRLIAAFIDARHPDDPRLDIVTFGTSGLPGDAPRTVAIVDPVDTLARAAIDALIDLLAGRGSVSRIVSPHTLIPSAG